MEPTTLTLEIPAIVNDTRDATTPPVVAPPNYFRATTDEPSSSLLYVGYAVAIAAHLAIGALLANVTVPLPVASAAAADAGQTAVVEVTVESVKTVPAAR